MSVFSRALEVAFVSLGETFLTTLAGSVAILAGYLDSHSLRRISTFMVKLLFPCLMLSLFTSFDTERLSRWSPVLLVALLHILLGALLALITTRLLRLPAQHSRLLILSAAFGNSGSLPFVLTRPVFENWSVTAADPQAGDDADGIIALYLAMWSLIFFSGGKALAQGVTATEKTNRNHLHVLHLAEAAKQASESGGAAWRGADALRPQPESAHTESQEGAQAGGSRARKIRRLLWRMTDRTWVCVLLGIGLGCISPLRDVFESGALRWVGNSWKLLGRAAVVLATMVLGASLAQAGKQRMDEQIAACAGEEGARKPLPWWVRSVQSIQQISRRMNDAIDSMTAGAANQPSKAQNEPSKVDKTAQTAAPLTPPVASPFLAASPLPPPPDPIFSLALEEESTEVRSEGERAASPRLSAHAKLVLASALLKLVLLPSICMPLTQLAAARGLLRDDPVLLMTLHIQSAVPSSLTAVALLVASGRSEQAHLLSSVYLPQYLLSTLTLSAVIIIAVQMLE